MFNAHLAFSAVLVLPARRFPNQRFLIGRERARLIRETFDRRSVAVGRNQRRQGLHQMPGRAVYDRFITRVEVVPGPAMPALTARNQFQLDNSLGSQVDGHRAIQRLHRHGHIHAGALAQRCQNVRLPDYLREVWRADLFLAFGHEHEVHRKFPASGFERVQRGQPRRFRSLLIDSSAADQHLAQSWLVYQGRIERRRRPFRFIGLLHVVHEIDAEGSRRARVERGENTRMPLSRNLRHLAESGIAQEAHHEIATLGHAPVFRCDRRLPDPILQSMHRFVVTFLDLGMNRFQIGCIRRLRSPGGSEQRGGRDGPLKERAAAE